jgi:ABC-type nickel/cobalt efflux system permease component RcnA
MTRSRWLRSLPLAVAIAALPAVAAAHPLGNFSINHYAAVTVTTDAIEVDLVIDLAEIPTIEVLPAIDRDADGDVVADELAVAAGPACRARAADLRVAVAGRPLSLTVESSAIELAPGAGGLRTMRTACILAASIGQTIESPATVEIADEGDPDRLGWREIVVRGAGVAVDPQAAMDVSRRLTAYPDDLIERPLDERSVVVTVSPGGGGTTAPGPDAGASPESGNSSPGIDFGAFSPAAALLGVLLAAATGAGHALTPGHGKTLMAAYLVGTRGRPRDALLLGLAVTASHSLGVLALAGIVLVAGGALPADRLYPVLSGLSGLLVVGIGAWLLIGCLRQRRVHDHAHRHDHPHLHPHPHDAGGVGRGGLLAIGLAGGMIPSPAALVLLLGAIAAGQPAYGLLLAVAFGAGMAVVLVALGLLVVRGRAQVVAVARRLPALVRLAPAVPWVAAAVVLVGGIALTGGAVAAAI